MKTNVGNYDRIIRIVAGIIIIALGIYFQSWWGLLGLVFVLTAFLRFCPIYSLLGFSTCAKSNAAR